MTKEEEILKAAEAEFFSNGYELSSTVAIARRAGVTHAMVNYYFRSKERLFMKVLDCHVYELLGSLKPLMHADGDFIKTVCDTAEVIFGQMDRNRRLPYLLSDISRNHPEFLLRYKETFDTVCGDSIRMHAERLKRFIENGTVVQCSMSDVYNTVVTLAIGPFMNLPLLENVVHFSPEQTDAYLQERRKEMVLILKARYSARETL